MCHWTERPAAFQISGLSPVERAVFVLREALGYEYGEMAEMLNKTETNCLKIFSQAKLKIRQDGEAYPEQLGDPEPLVKSFLSAAHTGNFAEFVRLLTEDAVLITDGGGKRCAAVHPIFGRLRIQALFEGIAAKGSLHREWITPVINGQLRPCAHSGTATGHGHLLCRGRPTAASRKSVPYPESG